MTRPKIVKQVDPKIIVDYAIGNSAWSITIITCPWCNGEIGIDTTFLEETEELPHCPYCLEEIAISDNEDDALLFDIGG